MMGNVDAVVVGCGTGGTAVGVGQYLKSKKPDVELYVVEPAESRVMMGETHRVHSITGIGTGLCVPMMEKKGRALVKEFLAADSADSLDMALCLAKSYGLLVGPSTGAAVKAALDLALRPKLKGKRICVVAPSSGVRYLMHPLFSMIRQEAQEALSSSFYLQ